MISQFFRALQKPIQSLCLKPSKGLFEHIGQKTQHQIYKDLSPAQLVDTQLMGNILKKTYLPKRSLRSQRGLFHGKQKKSGNQTCFSEKKTRTSWTPNVHTKKFYSDVLKRQFELDVSTKAMKCMRKLGGFDNYILLTKPQNLDSLYGEYLRKLMLTKLNNPDFQIPYIVKQKRIRIRYSTRNRRMTQRAKVIHPKEQRHTDLSHLRVKKPNEMSKRELDLWNELTLLDKNQEDMSTSHPYLKELEEKRKQQEIKLAPEIKLAQQIFEKTIKDKKAKAQVRQQIDDAQKELQNPPSKLASQKEEKKKSKN